MQFCHSETCFFSVYARAHDKYRSMKCVNIASPMVNRVVCESVSRDVFDDVFESQFDDGNLPGGHEQSSRVNLMNTVIELRITCRI